MSEYNLSNMSIDELKSEFLHEQKILKREIKKYGVEYLDNITDSLEYLQAVVSELKTKTEGQ